jgi:hypothetical protein
VSNTTPRVGFYMPADDGTEPVNVATDLNDNLEKIDSTIGFVPATSGADPTLVFDGMGAYETDTGRAKFRKGGVWSYILSAGAAFASNLLMAIGNRIGIGTTTPEVAIDIRTSSVVTEPTIFRYREVADTHPRLQLDVDGIKLGPGIGPTDVQLYRPTSNQLAVVGNLSVGSQLSVTGDTSLSNLSITGSLDIDGPVVGDLTVAGKFSGTGINVPNYYRKTVDQSKSNTTTITDDNHFLFYAEANTTYFVQTYFMYSASTTGDFKYAWSVPSGAFGIRWVLGEPADGTNYASTTMRTAVYVITTEVSLGGHTTGLFNGAMDTMTVTTASTPGFITLRWAQNTSSADLTTVRAGSVMVVRKLQ